MTGKKFDAPDLSDVLAEINSEVQEQPRSGAPRNKDSLVKAKRKERQVAESEPKTQKNFYLPESLILRIKQYQLAELAKGKKISESDIAATALACYLKNRA